MCKILRRAQYYILIDTFCNDHRISKAGLIVAACKEYIKRYESGEGKESISELKTINTVGESSENSEEV